MTDRHQSPIDDAVAAVRNDVPSDAEVAAATGRVWQRVTDRLADAGPLRGCDDVRALLPAYLAGQLGERREMLIADHTRECVACRRELIALRRGEGEPRSLQARSGVRIPAWLRLAAAGLLVVAAGALTWRLSGDWLAARGFEATVVTADGGLVVVAGNGTRALHAGDTVAVAQRLRTERDGGAMLRLSDGSLVEVDARSELQFTAGQRGSTIRLERGNVLVHAADQGRGRLAVATDDCLVTVRGTIFAVSNGLTGSRVSVIEGEVEVRHQGNLDRLQPGDQVTTGAALAAVPVERDIAWSRDADRHIALLHELTALKRDIARAVESAQPRRSTRLLELAPAGTVAYAAMPNLTEGLTTARSILAGRLATSPTLKEWWNEQVADKGFDRELEQLVERLRPLGSSIGDEIVATLTERTVTGDGGPIVLAGLSDSAGFVSALQSEIARLATEGKTPLALVADPDGELPSDVAWLVWVEGDLAVAATDAVDLRAAAAAVRDPEANPFRNTELSGRLEEAYSDGVAWLVGIDVHSMLASAGDDAGEMQVLERFGLLDATTLIVEHHREDSRGATEASLDFADDRHGVAAWLAEPAPMGSLGFFSPQTAMVSAAVAKDAVEMFDDLVGTLASVDQEVLAGLDEIRQETGIDLREDLAVALGGEGAFGIDGPILPVPSWKLVLEVYDPVRLQATLERAVAEVNRRLEAEGEPPLTLSSQNAAGVTFWVLSGSTSPVSVAWVMSDGYLVAGPTTAVLRHALMVRSSGVTLPSSGTLQNLLPPSPFTDCSALAYHHLGDLAQTAAQAGLLGELPPGVDLTALGEPSLFCVWAEPRRITVAGNGPSLIEALPLGSLGQASPRRATGRTGTTGVSSAP